MSKKSGRSNNMQLAGIFVLGVVGLIILSSIFKVIFLIKDSRFDGVHKFNVQFNSSKVTNIVSFSPQAKSISILSVSNTSTKNFAKQYEILVDGRITSKNDLREKNISSILLKSILPFGNKVENLTIIDLVRLTLFTRSVSQNSIFERGFIDSYNEAQKSNVISLSFTDPHIYQENQSIEVVNATSTFGLGTRLALLISNLGGNVILVTSEKKEADNSKIIYFGEKTYTVKRLGEYLNFPMEKTEKKGIADVIIIIGKDKLNKLKF
jgi:hypothetical protein